MTIDDLYMVLGLCALVGVAGAIIVWAEVSRSI